MVLLCKMITCTQRGLYVFEYILIYSIIFIFIKIFFHIQFRIIGIEDWCVTFSSLKLPNRFDSQSFWILWYTTGAFPMT